MTGPFALFKWEALFKDWRFFAEGLGITLLVSFLALLLALILGIIFGIIGASKNRNVKRISSSYVAFFQNTPLVIQIFFLYSGLPMLGITLPVLSVGVLGVGLYHGAYMAEVVRGGIEAVPKGQMEAAISQSFTYTKAMRYIILPQAKRIIIPPMTNQIVSLVKNTSVMAIIAGGDIMYSADSWASNNLYYGPAYVITGMLYLAICIPLAMIAKQLENKSNIQGVA